MENCESGDDLANSFLQHESQGYIMHDDIDDDGDPNLAAENTDDSCHETDKHSTLIREQDRFLPIANVAKIMKKAIPDSGKIAKDARECVQECVSEFISFITSEASDRCHMEKRKTINGEDILFAMTSLGFDNYVEPLKLYLQKYREATKGDKTLTATDMYEEIPEEAFGSQTLNGNIVPTGSSDQGGTIMYTFQEHIQPFQLS
ncbi:nuclear transcription factor Y subunit beta [Anabrus simplex]|uniref:nuclear transcription factor Y subunit beta n=1 Tax=Anabrus simplex TaxID=316456 RepID=UPI0034DCC687